MSREEDEKQSKLYCFLFSFIFLYWNNFIFTKELLRLLQEFLCSFHRTAPVRNIFQNHGPLIKTQILNIGAILFTKLHILLFPQLFTHRPFSVPESSVGYHVAPILHVCLLSSHGWRAVLFYNWLHSQPIERVGGKGNALMLKQLGHLFLPRHRHQIWDHLPAAPSWGKGVFPGLSAQLEPLHI